jgi:hypothetical protein
MAREPAHDPQDQSASEAATETVAEAPPAAEAAAAPAAPTITPVVVPNTGDSRFIVLKLDAQAATDLTGVVKADGHPYAAGDTMKRKEYILARWSQKIGRGPISKELTRLEGKNVAYQIVFQATDKVPGGPDKAAQPVMAAAPAAPAAPASAEAPATEAPAAE